MKCFIAFIFVFSLAACAGNPPQWWDPSGIYQAEAQQTAVKPAKKVVAKQADEIPAEEDIGTTLEEYEELRLTDTGEVQEISHTHTDVVSEESKEQADPMYAVDEKLPEDGSLPEPTVLE